MVLPINGRSIGLNAHKVTKSAVSCVCELCYTESSNNPEGTPEQLFCAMGWLQVWPGVCKAFIPLNQLVLLQEAGPEP